MRRERLLRRGWAHGLLFTYAFLVLCAMIIAGGLPRF